MFWLITNLSLKSTFTTACYMCIDRYGWLTCIDRGWRAHTFLFPTQLEWHRQHIPAAWQWVDHTWHTAICTSNTPLHCLQRQHRLATQLHVSISYSERKHKPFHRLIRLPSCTILCIPGTVMMQGCQVINWWNPCKAIQIHSMGLGLSDCR